jgi:glycosyltransferase involved in cell wall biosynthesis
MRPLRVLTFTTLFPSAARPRHGIFVETRTRKLNESAGAQVRVVAPVPWFPWRGALFGEYGSYARTPRHETRGGLEVTHPRYPMLPKVGFALQPASLARFAAPSLQALLRSGFDFDVVDAHYFYPDGIAATALARAFGRPCMITARGSDINLISGIPSARRKILRAAAQAGAIGAVSQALAEAMAGIGIARERITVLRNGVDLELFHELPRGRAREALGLPAGPLIACVGNLVPEKGFDLALQAVSRLPAARVLLVGEGPQARELAGLARALGMERRLLRLPIMDQRRLMLVYNAADVLLLTSVREGWPNVVLEAMACGTPVVASAVGGAPEIVCSPHAGTLVAERSAPAFAAALQRHLDTPVERAAVRECAAAFGWQQVTRRQLELLRSVAAARGAAHGPHLRTVESHGR